MTRPGCLAAMRRLDEGLGEEEGALEIDVEDGVVVGFGDLPEGGFDLDAGVVDEDVAAAELLVGLVDEALGVGEVGDVGLDGDGFAAGGFGFGFGVRGLLGVVAIVDDYGCAFAGEADGDGLADSGAGPVMTATLFCRAGMRLSSIVIAWLRCGEARAR